MTGPDCIHRGRATVPPALAPRPDLAPTSPGRGGRVVYALAWLNVAVQVLEVLAR